MSEAAPSSMPEAAARLRTPPRALVDCSTSHPASAIYFRASAASDAEKVVVAPNSRAQASSVSSSSPVAPDIACTSDMVLVKFWPSSMTLLTRSLIPSIAARIASAARFASVALKTVKPSSASRAESSTCSSELSSWSAAFSASCSRCRFSFRSLLSSWICAASSLDSSVVSSSDNARETYRSLSFSRVLSCSLIVSLSWSASLAVSSMPEASCSAACCAASSVPRFSSSSLLSSWI